MAVLKGKAGVRRRFLIAASPSRDGRRYSSSKCRLLSFKAVSVIPCAHSGPLLLLDFVDVAVGTAHEQSWPAKLISHISCTWAAKNPVLQVFVSQPHGCFPGQGFPARIAALPSRRHDPAPKIRQKAI
jgi:hypothetical protein